MSDGSDLYRAILEEPFDDDLRLVYADWLEENGDPDRAEFIRVQMERFPLDWSDDRRQRLVSREHELLKSHRAAWAVDAGVAADADIVFERGLPCELCLSDEAELARLPPLPWLERLRLRQGFEPEDMVHLARQPNLRLVGLDHTGQMDRALEAFSACPRLVWVVPLDEDLRIGPDAMELFRRECLERWDTLSPAEQRREAMAFLRHCPDAKVDGPGRDGLVRKVKLDYWLLMDVDLEYLRAFPELEEIDLSDREEITSAGLGSLAGLTNLRTLRLAGTAVTRLDHLKELTNLRVLSLSGTRGEPIRDDDTEALETLHAIEDLDLSESHVGEQTLRRLGAMHRLRKLVLDDCPLVINPAVAQLAGLVEPRELSLAGTSLSDAGLSALSGLTNLEHLNLSRTTITDAELGRLSGLARLRALQLHVTEVTPEAAERLADRLPEALISVGADTTAVVIDRLRPAPPTRHHRIDRLTLDVPAHWEVDDPAGRARVALRDLRYSRIAYASEEAWFPWIVLQWEQTAPGATAEELLRHGPPQRPKARPTEEAGPDLDYVPAGARWFATKTEVSFVAVWLAEGWAYRLSCATAPSRRKMWEETFIRLARSVRVKPAG